MKICWNLTNICNEDCIYCFRELAETARPLEDNITILSKLAMINVTSITFAGGEPLLYKDLLSLMSYSKKMGIKNSLITNGRILNKSNLEMYLKDVDKLTFSIDSPSEYVNELSGRGKNHFNHIKELLPIIKEKFPNIILEVNTVATNMNLQEVDFMFESIGGELSFYGIKKWKISRFCPLRGFAKERQNFLNIPSPAFEAIKDKYDGKNAIFEISVRDHDSIEENMVISPQGSLKKAHNNNEITLIEDLSITSSHEIKKKLSLEGYHV